MAQAGAGPENQAVLRLRACGWSGPAGAWVGMPSAAAPALDRLSAACRPSAALLAAAACAACCCAWRTSPTAPASLETRRQMKRGRRVVRLAAACHGQEPGGGPEPVSLCGPVRDLPVGGPRGPVERVGGPAQRRITDRPGGGMERGGRRPGRIGGRGWVSPGAAPDLLRRRLGLPGRVQAERVPFRCGEPERAGA